MSPRLHPIFFPPLLLTILASTAYTTSRSLSSSYIIVNIVALFVLWGIIASYVGIRNNQKTVKISRRNSGKDGLLDGGAKEIGEMLGRVERRRRRCAGVCVVGVVMAVVTDRALGGVGGICGKVLLPIFSWIGYRIFLAPSISDFDYTTTTNGGTISTIIRGTSKRVLVLLGTTLFAGLSCWGGYSSRYTTALGVLNLLGYTMSLLSLTELIHHEPEDNTHVTEDEEGDTEYLQKLVIIRDLFGLSAVALLTIAIVMERFMIQAFLDWEFVGRVICAIVKWAGYVWIVAETGVMGGAFLETCGCVLAIIWMSTVKDAFLRLGMLGAAAFWFAGDLSGGKMNMRTMRARGPVMAAVCGCFVLGIVLFTIVSSPIHSHPLPGKGDDTVGTPGKLKQHPVVGLIQNATSEYNTLRSKQSTTLSAAVKEYKRRYGLVPPPHFDRWYEYARKNKVEMIDEFDSMMDEILPFWALAPEEIRKRNRQALEYEKQGLIILSIRDGQISFPNKEDHNGYKWMTVALEEMVADFVDLLPDMDLGLNIHDEPRVVVANTDMELFRKRAKENIEGMKGPMATFENRNTELPIKERPLPVPGNEKTTYFNVFAHQNTWTHARLACAGNTPVRSIDPGTPDAAELFLTTTSPNAIPFVNNLKNFKDVCIRPSLQRSHGVFTLPNAYNVAQYLIPVLSQSKVNTYADILYPSPWYWAGKAPYYPNSDKLSFSQKKDVIFWRGSTTGSFSRAQSWKQSHRQIFIGNIKTSAPDSSLTDFKILDPTDNYSVKTVSRESQHHLFDVGFNHVGQCDDDDCTEQTRRFSPLKPSAEFQLSWANKLLLDLDGNAFSGRFYAFLKSKSAVLKSATFKEWHEDWITPWYHFIPLGQEGTEVPELVRWGIEDEEGREVMETLAKRGQEWRGGDREAIVVWFWRLLMELGRVMGDGREGVGFDLD